MKKKIKYGFNRGMEYVVALGLACNMMLDFLAIACIISGQPLKITSVKETGGE